MEISNKHIIIVFLCLLLLLAGTLYEINHFMPIIATCEDDIALINKCGCDIWGVGSNPVFQINWSNLTNG